MRLHMDTLILLVSQASSEAQAQCAQLCKESLVCPSDRSAFCPQGAGMSAAR